MLTADPELNRELLVRFEKRGTASILIEKNEREAVIRLEMEPVDLVIAPLSVLKASDGPLLTYWNQKPNGLMPIVLISSKKMTPQERQNLNSVKGMSLMMTESTDPARLQQFVATHLPKRKVTPPPTPTPAPESAPVVGEEDGKPLGDLKDLQKIEFKNQILHIKTGEIFASTLLEYDETSMSFEIKGMELAAGDEIEVYVNCTIRGQLRKLVFGSIVIETQKLEGENHLVVVGLEGLGDDFTKEIAAELEERQAEVINFLRSQR